MHGRIQPGAGDPGQHRGSSYVCGGAVMVCLPERAAIQSEEQVKVWDAKLLKLLLEGREVLPLKSHADLIGVFDDADLWANAGWLASAETERLIKGATEKVCREIRAAKHYAKEVGEIARRLIKSIFCVQRRYQSSKLVLYTFNDFYLLRDAFLTYLLHRDHKTEKETSSGYHPKFPQSLSSQCFF